jgi:hypothetical protein
MASRPDGDRPSSSSPDQLDAALEAGSAALLALQLFRCQLPDHGLLTADLVRAIESLRHAIREVRIARAQRPSIFAFGFVVGRRATGPRPDGEPCQSKACRTA